MLHYFSLVRFLAISFAASCFLFCALTVMAQSGRRVHKPAPVSAPTPEAKPSENKPPEKEKAAISFVVGVDRYFGFSNIPLGYYDTIARGCAERLDQAPGAKADVAPREMSRSDAVLRAKAEKEAFVVWLQLKAETFRGDASRVDNLSQLYIEYEVFAPKTAKRLTWGHTYQQGYRRGGVIVSPGTGSNNPTAVQYLLKQAAAEAAERILNALKIQRSPEPLMNPLGGPLF